MESFDLPPLNGLHLVPGLCDAVLTDTEALAGFPSMHTLPHTPLLGFHGVNVHGSESRNKSMVVHIKNPYEDTKTEDITKEMVGPHSPHGIGHWKMKAERIETCTVLSVKAVCNFRRQ